MHEGQSQTKANAGMHHFVSGQSFAMLVATILFCMLALNLLKKKKRGSTPLFRCPTPTGQYSDQYDVFLSFRGSDTRMTFADHLYHGLVKAGTVPICVFRDKDSISIGEEFGSKILDSITRSKISIPIISENYASSKWCLRELIHMMNYKKSMSHIVLPIFYKVKPADVRYLKGKFGEAFYSSKKRFDKKDIEEGQQALREVSVLHAWESEEIADGYEGELIERVVKTVLTELRKDFKLHVPKELVGLHGCLKEIMRWIDSPSVNARMIGIYGMGGIGKTTLAKCIYNQLSNKFAHVSFLPDVRETTKRCGIVYLQNLLISDMLQSQSQVSRVDDGINIIKSSFKGKKVLILLDDIDHKDQLDALAREHDWFSAGSLIIVTTRYEAVLDQSEFEVGYKYKLNELDEVYSLLLFNRHAFRMDHSTKGFGKISRDIISTMGGLPLTVKVIGSYLYNKTDLNVWKDILEQLEEQPPEDVRKTLNISYNALEEGHKKIFLDIACFFIGQESKYAVYMWHDCGFYPSKGIEELKLRCLVNIGDDGTLSMHDQLRDFGRSIVRQGPFESRSRLWVPEEASRVLKGEKGTETIEAICLDHRWGDQTAASMSYRLAVDFPGYYSRTTTTHAQTYTNEHFKNLWSLRFLLLGMAALSGDFNNLLSELRWLHWFCMEPDLSFSATNLHLPKLVVLQLQCNNITEHWRGWSLIMAAKRLKVLELAGCYDLRRTPDLSAFTELEILILKDCSKLEQVHPSIGKVKTLVSLDLSECDNLNEIPTSIGSLRKLEKLSAVNCWSLREIPSSIGNLSSLQDLNLSGCQSLREIPSSIWNLSSLQHLNLGGCWSLREIPSSIGNLSSLQHLNLGGCRSLREIPSSIGNLSSLQDLNLSGFRSLREVPSSIWNLSSLQHLNLGGSRSLREIPSSIGNLSSLQDLNLSRFRSLREVPSSIWNLSSLQHLNLSGCWSLREIPSSIGDLQNLQHLDISHTAIEEIPGAIGRLKKLRRLNVAYCVRLKGKMPREMVGLFSLGILEVTTAKISDPQFHSNDIPREEEEEEGILVTLPSAYFMRMHENVYFSFY